MRIISFITLLFLSTLLPPVLLFLMAVGYALMWRGYELIVLGACIDAYYGIATSVPYYTLTSIVIVFCAEWIKPVLLVYNK